jgi:hypothetical protein
MSGAGRKANLQLSGNDLHVGLKHPNHSATGVLAWFAKAEMKR